MERNANGCPSSPQSETISESPGQDHEETVLSDEGSDSEQQSPIVPLVPPHWLHQRRESYASIIDDRPAAITLEDHTEGPLADNDAVWAKAIYIEDYHLVSGNVPSVGAFIVWHTKIETIEGTSMVIRKRYSEFLGLRKRLLVTFPKAGRAMPPFPPKSIVRESSPHGEPWRRATLMGLV